MSPWRPLLPLPQTRHFFFWPSCERGVNVYILLHTIRLRSDLRPGLYCDLTSNQTQQKSTDASQQAEA